jgi:peptide deformylase
MLDRILKFPSDEETLTKDDISRRFEEMSHVKEYKSGPSTDYITLTIPSTPLEPMEHFTELKEMADWLMQSQEAKDRFAMGLALPQIGINKRGFVIIVKGRPVTVINPKKIIPLSGTKNSRENCLSFPGRPSVNVTRFNKISATFIGLSGKERTMTFEGFEACLYQHELDHLNGKLIGE